MKRFGRDHAQAAWDAGLAAIAQIDAIVGDLEIACDFAWVPGLPPRARWRGRRHGRSPRLREEAALATELGFDATFVSDVPFVGGPGVRFDGQARFHPRKYLAGLARAITDRGGMIFEHSAAETFCDQPRSVTSNGHTLACGAIVLATHTPLMGNTGLLSATLFQTKLALYTSYVVGGRVPKGRSPTRSSGTPPIPITTCASSRTAITTSSSSAARITRPGRPPTPRPASRASRHAGVHRRRDRDHASLVGTGDRDAGRPAVHRRDRRSPVRRHRLFRQRHDVRHARRHDGGRSRGRPREPVERAVRSAAEDDRGGLWDYVKENKDYPYYSCAIGSPAPRASRCARCRADRARCSI